MSSSTRQQAGRVEELSRRSSAPAPSRASFPYPEGGTGALWDAIVDLRPDSPTFTKWFGAELTVPEMAEALGEPLTTVEGRVYRALRKLREHLD